MARVRVRTLTAAQRQHTLGLVFFFREAAHTDTHTRCIGFVLSKNLSPVCEAGARAKSPKVDESSMQAASLYLGVRILSGGQQAEKVKLKKCTQQLVMDT